MKTLIAYATKYGATKACAEQIAAKLSGDVHLLPLTMDGAVDLSPYEAVIVGTPIYISKPRKEVSAFVKRYQAELLTKKLGLFLCCIQDESPSLSQQFQVAFPKELRDHAAALAVLGGVVDRANLGFLDGLIMKMVSANMKNNKQALDTISQERIDQLVSLMR